MPLRLGSAGLKYPLPNKAETQARQNAAAASAGGSASASAYSANRRYAGLKKELRYKSLEAGLDRGFKAQQSFFDREHQKGSQLSRQEAQDALQGKRIAAQDIMQGEQHEFERKQQKRRHKYGDDTAKLKRDQQIKDRDRDTRIQRRGEVQRGERKLSPADQQLETKLKDSLA